MQLRQNYVLDTGQRVQTFLDTQAAALGTIVPASVRAKLDTAVTQLAAGQKDEHALLAGSSAEIVKQNTIRKEVTTDFLIPIADIVRRTFGTSPDFQVMIVPAKSTRKGKFLTAVTGAADAAALHQQDLIDHGLPADVVAKLQAAVAQFAGSATERSRQLGLLKGARATITNSTKALRDVLQIMDRNMRRELKANPSLLANWIATKKIQATVVTPLPGGDLNAGTSAPQPAAAVIPTAKPAA